MSRRLDGKPRGLQTLPAAELASTPQRHPFPAPLTKTWFKGRAGSGWFSEEGRALRTDSSGIDLLPDGGKMHNLKPAKGEPDPADSATRASWMIRPPDVSQPAREEPIRRGTDILGIVSPMLYPPQNSRGNLTQP